MRAAQIAHALKEQGKDVALALAPMEANSYGVAMLDGGLTLAAAAQRMQDGARALVLENDLHRRMPAAANSNSATRWCSMRWKHPLPRRPR